MVIKGDYDYITKLAMYNVCSEHKTPLIVAWYDKSWVLRCAEGGGHYPDSVTGVPATVTEMFKQGEQLPEHIEDKVKKRLRGVKMTTDKSSPVHQWLIPRADLGTGESLPAERLDALIKYARDYGLDPERGHVVMMYGLPYITLDGYLYHARKSGRPYSMASRPLVAEELVNFRSPENAHTWVCVIKLLDTGEVYSGYGVVTYDEITRESERKPGQLRSPVVAANPQIMAQKRSEWQALRRAFPIGGD